MREELASALDILRQAIRIEQDGHKMYLEAAERTTDAQGKRMFRSLVQDEEEHMRILQNEYGALSSTGEWMAIEGAKSKEPPEATLVLFPQEEGAGSKMIGDDTTDLDALRLARDFEKHGYEMYQKAAETSNFDAQAVYRYLAKEENKHFTLLQKTYEYLSQKGSWFFDDLEKPHFDAG